MSGGPPSLTGEPHLAVARRHHARDHVTARGHRQRTAPRDALAIQGATVAAALAVPGAVARQAAVAAIAIAVTAVPTPVGRTGVPTFGVPAAAAGVAPAGAIA